MRISFLWIGVFVAMAGGLAGCAELPQRGFLTRTLFGASDDEARAVAPATSNECYRVATQRADDAAYGDPDIRSQVFENVLKTCTASPGHF